MTLPTWYSTGTVSVESESTTVTLTGGYWGDDNIMPGDLFCDPAQPLVPPQRVKSVTANDEIELWAPWPGDSIEDGAYEIRYVGIIERSTAQTRKVLEDLGGDSLRALAGQTLLEGNILRSTGPTGFEQIAFTDAMAQLADDPDFTTMRVTMGAQPAGDYQENLGFAPVEQGGGTGQGTNKIRIGWSGTGLKAQVDAIDLGYFLLGPAQPAVNFAANGYQRLPSGLILQWGYVDGGGAEDLTVGFPISFPVACFGANITDYFVLASTPGLGGASFISVINNDLFTLRRRYTFTGSVAPSIEPVFWSAWGY